MMPRLIRLLGVSLAILTGVFAVATRPLSGQAGAQAREWRTWGGDLANTKYSPLDQINTDNFNKLEVAWRFKTDALGPAGDATAGDGGRWTQLGGRFIRS